MSNDDDDTQYDEAQVRAMIKQAVLEEREACAKVCEKIDGDFDYVYANAIRARGRSHG